MTHRGVVMRTLFCRGGLGLVMLLACAGAHAQEPWTRRVIREADYEDRLRAMWLGQCIANWTGLRTEGLRQGPPFYTDADWGSGGWIVFVLNQDPWLADDDTDIEAAYLQMMESAGTAALSSEQISAGWVAHINRFIWVSNQSARTLIGRGVRPPSTSMPTTNANRLMIDAQLTTELFGAMAPGSPARALELADAAISVTARGHAAHAAQFYVVLYALATQADPAWSGREKALWLVAQARAALPDSSKAGGIVDFVVADFLSNPDLDDWERTRDRIYEKYQRDAALNGFVYRAWYESSVNFACGVMALLYGQCDYRRTVQIGTLSGWDSDNATATLGGLLGLMLGRDAIVAQFPGSVLSDRFDIARTRDAMIDHLPDDLAAQDTFALMAVRAMPLVRAQVEGEGGVADPQRGAWLLAPARPGVPREDNPRVREDARSVNNTVRRAGGVVQCVSSVVSTGGWATGSANPSVFGDGHETSHDGREEGVGVEPAYTSLGSAPPPLGEVALTVQYDREVTVSAIRFIEGDHFSNANIEGGYFAGLTFEVRAGGVWAVVSGTLSEALDPARPFQCIDLELAQSIAGITEIRVRGPAGGLSTFVTCSELDALLPESGRATRTFDRNQDGRLDSEDLHEFGANPADLDGNGSVGVGDAEYLRAAVRWREIGDLLSGRP